MELANPMFVPSTVPPGATAGVVNEGVWEGAVDVLHDYQFQIARENKLDGLIETEYKVGSGLLEFWQHDSVGFEERLESSLQSMRRRAFVHLSPAEGGYLIGVQVYKEIEDAPNAGAENQSLRDYTPLKRDVDVITGRPVESGWVNRGRDPQLERAILQSLQAAFSR
jgi:hypothetical protein